MSSADNWMIESQMTMGEDRVRCPWAVDPPGSTLYRDYHDEEWGRGLHGRDELFERLALEAFQTGGAQLDGATPECLGVGQQRLEGAMVFGAGGPRQIERGCLARGRSSRGNSGRRCGGSGHCRQREKPRHQRTEDIQIERLGDYL